MARLATHRRNGSPAAWHPPCCHKQNNPFVHLWQAGGVPGGGRTAPLCVRTTTEHILHCAGGGPGRSIRVVSGVAGHERPQGASGASWAWRAPPWREPDVTRASAPVARARNRGPGERPRGASLTLREGPPVLWGAPFVWVRFLRRGCGWLSGGWEVADGRAAVGGRGRPGANVCGAPVVGLVAAPSLRMVVGWLGGGGWQGGGRGAGAAWS